MAQARFRDIFSRVNFHFSELLTRFQLFRYSLVRYSGHSLFHEKSITRLGLQNEVVCLRIASELQVVKKQLADYYLRLISGLLWSGGWFWFESSSTFFQCAYWAHLEQQFSNTMKHKTYCGVHCVVRPATHSVPATLRKKLFLALLSLVRFSKGFEEKPVIPKLFQGKQRSVHSILHHFHTSDRRFFLIFVFQMKTYSGTSSCIHLQIPCLE